MHWTLLLIFIGYLFSTVIQLLFWVGVFSRLAYYRPRPATDRPRPEEPVSVVICARNEAENLRNNLPHFLNQTYRSFEILVVNDNSTDQTQEILLEFQSKNPKLRIVTIEQPTLPGKKTALTIGIKSARYGVLLLSDADCIPAGPHWIEHMQRAIHPPAEVGLGYSPYQKRPGLLNRFIRFETVYTATQYLSFALAGTPYMGVGRNLIYTRSLFQQAGGFQDHLHLASGDDDLFVNQVAHRNNTSIILQPGAFTYSEPERSWRGYYNQKRRHLTAGRKYRPLHQLCLSLLAASHLGHYLTGTLLLLAGTMPLTVFAIYLVRISVVSILYFHILDRLDDTALRKWIPLLDAVYVTYYLVFAPVLIFGNIKKWK